MNITIQIQAPELVKAIESLASALGNNRTGSAVVPVSEGAVMVEKETAEERFAEDVYFYHSESDSYFMCKKGDITPTDADFELSAEISKEDYEKGIAAQKQSDEEEKPTIPLETVRAKLAALTQAGKQTEAKALLTNFGVKKLTELPSDKYADLLAAAEEIA